MTTGVSHPSLSTVKRNMYEGKAQQSLTGVFLLRGHIMAPGKGGASIEVLNCNLHSSIL